MAGIGFELKKIFKERSVVHLLKGDFYSTFAAIGPMLIIILCFILLFVVMGYQHVDMGQKDLLTSIILYVFIFSLITTSPLSAVLSRYIADKIFEEKMEDILACYDVGLLIHVVIGAALCVPFLVAAIRTGGVDPLVMLLSGCMFMALLFVFYNMTFLSALKKYRSIALTFLAGMCVTLAVSYFLYKLLNRSFLLSVLSGMAAGFLVIALVLFALVRRSFSENSNRYREFLSYLGRYKLLLLTNFCYIMGLYIHNLVYWNVPSLSLLVAKVFRSAPVYDLATFLAMMTSVSATVIFTVRVKMNFHERYQIYCQELLGGIGDNIVSAKENMFSTLGKEILYIVQMQTIISVIIYLILTAFAPFFSFGGLTMTLYPALAAGYFVVYILYCMIVFLYYFNDGIGSLLSSLTFFIGTFAVSILATRLSPSLYGIGPFAGAFAGWTVAFFRLKYIEKNLDRVIFCEGEPV